MDLSLFNVLISTNNVDAANSMPFGVSPLPENQDQTLAEGVGKSDAFLKILENAKLNKTDSSSEIVFNSMSASAENGKNARLIAAGREVTKDTKIVKLSIKRTRPSEMYADKRTLRRIENAQRREVAKASDETVPQSEFSTFSSQTVEDTYNLVEQPQMVQNNEVVTTKQGVEFKNDLACADNFNMENSSHEPTQFFVSENGRIEIKDNEVELKVEENNNPKQIHFGKKEIKTKDVSELPENIDAISSQVISVKTNEMNKLNIEDVKIHLPEDIKEAKVNESEKVIENVNDNFVDENNVETKETNFEPLVNENKKSENKTPIKAENHKTVKVDNDVQIDNEQEIDSQFDFDNKESFTQLDTKTKHHQAAIISEMLPEDVNVNIKVQTFGFSEKLNKKDVGEKHDTRDALVEQKKDTFDTNALFKNVEQKDEASKTNVNEKHEELFKSLDGKAINNTQTKSNDDFTKLVLPTMNNVEKVENTTTVQAAKAGVSMVGETNNVQTNVLAEGQKNLKTSPNAQKTNNQPQMQKQTYELADQIKVKITKALKSGISRVEVILKPKELGTVKVQIVTKDGRTDIHLVASREETMKVLSNDIQVLKQSLADAGMNMENSTFSFSYAGQFAEKNNQQNQGNDADNKKMARDLHDDKQIAEVSATEQKATTVLGNHALNIRV
ncbi:MAG: flagellar hook-length control protein FliK [Alphaproteobacteria bacterium]|nr:flagellar hook-length control protein FliK [Alphaproteobacteria bacterium]